MMPTILSMKDRIKLKLGKVTFILKPLNMMEQQKVSGHKKMDAGVEVEDVEMTAFAYIKYAVKGIEGVKQHSKEDYKLDFEGDYLTDDCVSELFTLSLGVEFFHAIQTLRYNHIPEKLTYFGQTKALKGVKLEVIPSGGLKS